MDQQIDIADRLLDMSGWVIHNSIEQIRNDIALEAYQEIIELRDRVAELEINDVKPRSEDQ